MYNNIRRSVMEVLIYLILTCLLLLRMPGGRVSGMMKTSTLRAINMVVDAFDNKGLNGRS